MNRLSAILPSGQVLVDVDASSKKRVFEHAGLLFENQHAIARATVTDNLFARERLGSTGLGHGVAIPHGRMPGISGSVGAFLWLKHPVDYDAHDGQAVDLVFGLVVPAAATEEHLKHLAAIAEKFSDEGFCKKMRSAKDDRALYDLLVS